MATENKTKASKESVTAYISALPDETQRADSKALIKIMQRVTAEKPKLWGPSIVGFGSCHYKYESGREGDTPLAAFSPRKAGLVIYGMSGFPEVKELAPKLGKHKISGSCLHIKKLTDVDLKILETLIEKSTAATRKKYSS